MKRYLLLPLLCLAVNDAAAQRMRDFSLTPEETMQEPDIEHSAQGIGSPLQGNAMSIGNNLPDLHMENPDDVRGTILFMDRYCDPGFQPGMANPQLQPCLEETKKKACDDFQHLPPDAQHVLDQVISCNYDTLEAEGLVRDSDCSNEDMRRMQLLKKYWSEQNTTRAIVFLPDMVLDGATFCLKGGQ